MDGSNIANAINIFQKKSNHTEFWHKLNDLTEKIKVYHKQVGYGSESPSKANHSSKLKKAKRQTS